MCFDLETISLWSAGVVLDKTVDETSGLYHYHRLNSYIPPAAAGKS